MVDSALVEHLRAAQVTNFRLGVGVRGVTLREGTRARDARLRRVGGVGFKSRVERAENNRKDMGHGTENTNVEKKQTQK